MYMKLLKISNLEKYYVSILLFFAFVSNLQGQTPYVPANYAQIPATHNFVRSYSVLKPGLSASDIIEPSRLATEVQLSTQYLDGLGRPIQTVNRKGSLNTAFEDATLKDLVKLNTYDEFGRERHQFLPFVSAEGSGNFKGGITTITNPFQMHRTFYKRGSIPNPIAGQ